MCVSVWVHVMDRGVSVGPSSSPGPEQPRPPGVTHAPNGQQGAPEHHVQGSWEGSRGVSLAFLNHDEDSRVLPLCSSASWV